MARFMLAAAAVLALAAAAPAGAATWDATALDVSPGYATSPIVAAVAPADDGAVWAAWAVDPSGVSGPVSIFARRVSADGVPGTIRTLLTGGAPQNSASVSLVAVPGGAVRVSYVGAAGSVVGERTLTPDATGAETVLYDAATTDDGDATPNGAVTAQQLIPGPGGQTWALILRANEMFGGSPVVEARHIAATGTVGGLARASGATNTFEAAGAVDASGRLVVAMPLGGQGRVAATRVETDGTVGPEAVVRPPSPAGPFALAATPSIGIDAAGIATIGWRLDTPSSRIVQVQRLDSAATPMTTGGTPATPLDQGLPSGFVQYGPLLAVDPAGSAVAAWAETDSFTDNTDVIVRSIDPGPLSTTGGLGPRVQLDGPAPEGGNPAAALPGPAGTLNVFHYASLNNVASCDASRLTTAGALTGTDPLPTTCRFPYTPASADNGLAAAWTTSPGNVVQVARAIAAAPSCSDGAPVSVEAGTTTTLPLPCSGWRAVRDIVGAPTRGTLAAIDQVAGTVSYTAGSAPGTDTLAFRAANATGQGTTGSIPITVTAVPTTPAPPSPAPPATASAKDTTSPVVSALRLKPSKLTLSRLRSPVATFSLSEPATVTIVVERLRQGRRVKGRCLAARRKPAARAACTKVTRISQLTRSAPRGAARVTVAVRSGKRTLPSGSYRLTVRAVDAAGNRSTPATARFTIAF